MDELKERKRALIKEYSRLGNKWFRFGSDEAKRTELINEARTIERERESS